jgi:type II secretory pathway pseudopilin PulG
MKFFTRNELIGVIIILGIIGLISAYNFSISLRRARDAQRKSDMGTLTAGLVKFQEDFGTYPLASSDGRILACKNPPETPTKDSKGNWVINWIPCEWGKDNLRDVTDPSYPPYLAVLPVDPQNSEGVHYTYFSNGKTFQIYTSLEGQDEPEYTPKIAARGVSCGIRICNYGLALGNTPLDKSIEEYENETKQKN